jgi:hypothetical protein
MPPQIWVLQLEAITTIIDSYINSGLFLSRIVFLSQQYDLAAPPRRSSFLLLLNQTSPPSVSINLVPEIARKMISCTIVTDNIPNVLSLIKHFFSIHYC